MLAGKDTIHLLIDVDTMYVGLSEDEQEHLRLVMCILSSGSKKWMKFYGMCASYGVINDAMAERACAHFAVDMIGSKIRKRIYKAIKVFHKYGDDVDKFATYCVENLVVSDIYAMDEYDGDLDAIPAKHRMQIYIFITDTGYVH